MTKIIILLLALGIVWWFCVMYLMAYGLGPLGRFLPSGTLKSDESIEYVKYEVLSSFSQETESVTVLVYLQADGNKKLSKHESLSVNDTLINPRYYGTGFSYSAKIPQAESYVLRIKRQNGEVIEKIIDSKNISITFPTSIKKGEPFAIPYTAEGSINFEAGVSLNSLTDESIIVSEKYTRLLWLPVKSDNSSIIFNPESSFYSEEMQKFADLKSIPMSLSVHATFKQPDGVFALIESREVTITD